jgi:hypothetical protein
MDLHTSVDYSGNNVPVKILCKIRRLYKIIRTRNIAIQGSNPSIHVYQLTYPNVHDL